MKISVDSLAATLHKNPELSIFDSVTTIQMTPKKVVSAMLREMPIELAPLLNSKGIDVGPKKGISYRAPRDLQEVEAILSYAGSDEGGLLQDDTLDDAGALHQAMQLALITEGLDTIDDQEARTLFDLYYPRTA